MEKQREPLAVPAVFYRLRESARVTSVPALTQKQVREVAIDENKRVQNDRPQGQGGKSEKGKRGLSAVFTDFYRSAESTRTLEQDAGARPAGKFTIVRASSNLM